MNDSIDNEDQIHLHVKGIDSDYKTDEDNVRVMPQRSSLRTSGKMNYQDLNNNGTPEGRPQKKHKNRNCTDCTTICLQIL